MRIRRPVTWLGILLWAIPGSVFSYDKSQFLNFTLFHLPPEFFAGIPVEDRPALIQEASATPKGRQIDYENGYYHHKLPGGSDGESIRLWIKLLPRDTDPPVQNPYSPLVYVHVAKPATDQQNQAEPDYNYETFVLKWDRKSDAWRDVTNEVVPDSVDLSTHLPPQRKFAVLRVASGGFGSASTSTKELLVWRDWKFHLRGAYPFYSDYRWEAPFNPERLAILAFRKNRDYGDNRELAQLIVHAGMAGDEGFRSLLGMNELKEAPLLTYALAAYEYALDQSEVALEFILKSVAEEGNGDTDSKWMLSFFDEWDRTLETYHRFRGTDGAAAEAGYMFYKQREYFFPENFEKHWEKKMSEIKSKK